MLGWILDEAEEQVGEVCSGPYASQSSVKTIQGDDSYQSIDSDVDGSSASSSNRDSLPYEETKRQKLQQQARMLTQRILQRERSLMNQCNTGYDADESTVDNASGVPSSSTNGSTYYFAALNDARYGNHHADRSRSIFDEESESECSPVYESGDKRDVENGKACQSDVDRSKLEKKEEIRKRNKIWGFHKRNEPEQSQKENKRKLSAQELAEQKELAKKHETKKVRIFALIVIPLLILTMAGLGAFMAVTWNHDPKPNSSGNNGNAFDSQNPTVRFSPSSEEEETNYFVEEDLGSDSGENEELPPVDEDLLKKHLEAYETWKENNGVTDNGDDNFVSVDVEFDADYDETISLKSSSGDG